MGNLLSCNVKFCLPSGMGKEDLQYARQKHLRETARSFPDGSGGEVFGSGEAVNLNPAIQNESKDAMTLF